MTFEKFKETLKHIEVNKKEHIVHTMIELVSEHMNDENGYINHFCFVSDFGNNPRQQLIFDRNGKAITINNIEELWGLLKF